MSEYTPTEVSEIAAAESLIDALDDGILVLDADGHINALNAEARQILGVGAGQLAGKLTTVLAERCGDNWADVITAIEGGRNAELIVTGPAGKPIYVAARQWPRSRKRIGLLILRDLAIFDYRRRKASGLDRKASFGLLSDTNARPDFESQRALSPALNKLLSRGERAILQNVRILITGESGVGKTELARYLHGFVADRAEAFLVVNCASIPETLFESELFGYERGAFTGASAAGKRGLIEQAEGGTLFLDEIGEIPLTAQAKLLSFLEDGHVQRIGGSPKEVNVRVVTATNRDLQAMVRDGNFRADLYYRLAVVELEIPPLREMPELIDHLTVHFVEMVNLRRSTALELPDWVRQKIRDFPFPGNVRQLLNVVRKLSIFIDEDTDFPETVDEILGAHRGGDSGGAFGNRETRNLKAQVRVFERNLIDRAVALHGSKRKAAKALGVDIGTVVRKTVDGR